jgi:hypothetical protein
MRAIQSSVLSKIFAPKREEATGGWRKLYSEELHDLYCSPHIIKPTKSWRMWWADHVASMGKKKLREDLVGKNLKEVHHLDNRWIISNRILQNHAL